MISDLKRRGTVLPEPNLEFGDGERCPDPKAGISLFGPPSPRTVPTSPRSIRLAAIGSGQTASLSRRWMSMTRNPIASLRSGTLSQIDFPGFRQGVGFDCEAVIDDSLVETLPQRELDRLLKLPDFQARLESSVEMIRNSLENLAHREPPPMVTVLALPSEVIRACVTDVDRFGRFRPPRGQRWPRVPKKQWRIEDFLESSEEERKESARRHYSNLRRAIKFEAWRLGLETQIIWERTLRGGPGLQDLATIAWNLFVALYYKARGHPWHLARPHMGTCYVGVSFFRDLTEAGERLDASVAQVFSHTGEGMVFRGDRATHRDPLDRKPRLSRASARRIMEDAIRHYQSQTKSLPARLVVHKSSRYSEEELEGFRAAAEKIDAVDLLSIEPSRFVFYRQGIYPPLRGTMIPMEGYGTVLYTLSYSPYLGTYPGPGVPRPLAILEHHGDASAETLANDILSLTKLNWNTADFSSKLPITLQFADRVGDVLSQGKTEPRVPSRFSYFI
ncbi:MAG: hypothetical protein ACE5IJ_09615 [Thermoplasmata archaeon]